ncbi:hypothetical protein PanWU01x14_014990 [Parasponia andersonii]|uniref:Uncharacterized protein n=1 Tax=Parasponia andersonii TaxID=3476 RepID=A0A2P5E0D3_PARAD|nr:hypothetical protein PanWU01x14_014990 [Parasponia andersonii]
MTGPTHSFYDNNLRNRRVNSERSSAKRATRLGTEPPIHALGMVAMAALRQHLQLLSVLEHPEADTALRRVRDPTRTRLVSRIPRLVEDNRQSHDRGGVEALRRSQGGALRVGGGWGGEGGGVAVAADPAGIEEEEGDDEEDGEDDDDEEERAAADFEVAVVQDRVVPLQWLGLLGGTPHRRFFFEKRHVVLLISIAFPLIVGGGG